MLRKVDMGKCSICGAQADSVSASFGKAIEPRCPLHRFSSVMREAGNYIIQTTDTNK